MKKVSVLCCSVLQKEIETIFAIDYPDITVEFLDSMLHMRPRTLQQKLEEKLSEQTAPTLVIYGECGPSMESIEKRFDCIRTKGINCSELLLGRKRYVELRNKKAFLFLPEWTHRWKEVFQKELGFENIELARMFMHENSKYLYYLDTGILPIPFETLKEIEQFFDMPVEVISETLEPLRFIVYAAMVRLEKAFTNG